MRTGNLWLFRRQAWGPALSIVLVTLFALALGSFGPAGAQGPEPPVTLPGAPGEFKPGEALVKFEPGTAGSARGDVLVRHGATRIGSVYGLDAEVWQGSDTPVLLPISNPDNGAYQVNRSDPLTVTSYIYLPLALKSYVPPLIDEGFESGTWPPAGWTLIHNDPDPWYTWQVWPWLGYDPPTYPPAYEGLYSAACDGADGVEHEVLLSPPFQASSAQLQFQSFGDVFWCGNLPPYYGCGLNVWLVVGDWDGVDPVEPDVLVYIANQDWSEDPNGYFVWSPSYVDLTPFLPIGVPVRLGFENFADSYGGGLVGLDAIRLTRP